MINISNITNKFRKKVGKNLMIVAQPDDEMIFGGAALQSDNWKVICVTNGDNEVRSKEFIKVMNEVGAHYEIWNYEDVWNGDFDRTELEKDISQVLDSSYDKVVTHNKDGEYGHTQHKALHEIICKLVSKNLYVFGTSSQPLSFQKLLNKLRILLMYQSQKKALDWTSPNGRNMMEFIVNEKIIRIK